MALPEGTTKQGYEMQFGTNHVGHALLLKLLLPTLQSTSQLPGADVRVIMLSSVGHNAAGGKLPFAQLKGTMKEHNTLARYGFSKLANLVWAQQLSKRYPSITAVALHPGMVDSNLYATFTGQGVFSKLFGAVKAVGKCILPGVWLTVEEGAKNQLWAATATKGEGKGEVQAGKYYDPVGRPGTRFVDDATKDDKLGSELWEWTDEELAGWEL